MTFQPARLPQEEASLVRYLLRKELHQMHRPELADLLEAAEFAFSGRTLWIQPSTLESKSPVLEVALNLAALRAGLPVDSVRAI